MAGVKFGSPVVVVLFVFWLESRRDAFIAVPAFTIAAIFLAIGYYLGLFIG